MNQITPSAFPETPTSDYLASVARHYGGRMPTFEEMARAESRRMWRDNPGPSWRSVEKGKSVNVGRENIGRYASIDYAARQVLILGFLPGTAAEIGAKAGLSTETAARSLRAMRDEGLTVLKRVGQVSIWEAAE